MRVVTLLVQAVLLVPPIEALLHPPVSSVPSHGGTTNVTTREEVREILENYQKSYNDVTKRFGRFLHWNGQYLRDDDLPEDDHYDFIIVGSGSAGSSLANRLSETAKWRILLLEVGEAPTPLTDIPAIAPLFQFTDLNWNYLMERQEGVALGLTDRRMPWPRGRGLGGTTIINYMIHVRGNRLDYDRWARAGNPGWSYRDLFKYFVRSEDSKVKRQDQGYHGTGGYLSVEDVTYRTEAARAFVDAAQEAGHQYVDYNGKRQKGVSFVQATLRNGKRCGAEVSYLNVPERKNLRISTGSRAVEILIDEKTRRAVGVKYVKNRTYRTAYADKEVVLSAGAFNSPQLLILSGIGPKAHLQDLGIPLKQDLPVGKKLYDHLTFTGLTFTVNQSIVAQQSEVEDPRSLIQLITNGTGVLSNLGGVEALLYHRTNASRDTNKNYPDMEFIFIGGNMATDKGQYYRKTFRISDEVYDKVWKDLEGRYAFQILPMLVHPKSYGFLKLKSRNPYHWPKLYGRFFTDPGNEDIGTFIAAIREAQRIVRMPALQKYGAEILRTKIPGCQDHEFDSDSYWECALRHLSVTLHHQVATCKMGPSHDPEAVVDSNLRVYGIKNLRVADTSIIPIPLTAHTSVPAYIVGEKAADLIKDDWQHQDYSRKIDIRESSKYL